MCGIFGAIALNGIFEANDFNKFVGLTDMVDYRGPDDSGYKVFNTREPNNFNKEKFNIFLGHRRLSIIDLSEAGRQPLTDGKGLWIVYNGEIFNYIELREHLKKKGHFFNTETDTEVILEIYKEYEEAGFNHLNGMWAFIIMDMNLKKVIISRDRFSIKPLYSLRDSEAIYFASEIKQLIPLLKRKEINGDIMVKFLKQGLLDYNEETFFKSIYKIKPKSSMIINMENGDIKEEEYWNYATEEIKDEDVAIEKLKELLYDSLKIRLRSDVKVGTLLSGGLDSSTITLMTDKIAGGNLESFSVISQDHKHSEERFINILVNEKSLKHKKIYFEPVGALNLLQRVVSTQGEPFGSFSVIAQNLIFKEIKENTDTVVLLSGQGGDEILMGYLKYFFFNIKDLLRTYQITEAAKQLLLSSVYRTALWQLRLGVAKRYIPYLFARGRTFLKVKSDVEEVWKYKDLRERQILDIDKYSIPALTHYEDRNSMAYSLEVRHPFLDHRIVNFLVNVPVSLKLRNGWTKYLLRRAISELPPKIRWRRDKQGFVTPEEDWLRTNLKVHISETFKKSTLSEMGIIDSDVFLAFYDDFLRNKIGVHYSDISRVFIAELWARQFFA